MKVLRWLLPVVSLAIVLLVTFWDLRSARIGPGALHPAHAGLPAMDGGRNCEACHRVGEGIDPNACNKCHTAIGAQVASGRGLHGELPPSQRERCEFCHSDHHGDTAPLLASHAFALAGFPQPEAYDHRHVAFRLSGAHDGLACRKCHLAAEDVVPPTGGRFLGLTQTCTECHEDVHRAAFGADCESCHTQTGTWEAAPGFRHETFALRDSHRRVECTQCHEKGSAHDVPVLQREPPREARACVACHADPHGADPAVRKGLQLTNTNDCARCHDATTWAAARPTVEAHGAYFVLRGDHATTECTVCHGSARQEPRWRAAPPKLEDCAACHATHPHRDEVLAAAPTGCAGCHGDADADFRAGRMDATQHTATGFALVVPHADVACAKCHAGDTWDARFPDRVAADCRACHADVHGGQFDQEARYGQCTACHRPTTFHPAEFGSAAHGKTAFPLTGAHDAVACQRCHDQGKNGVRQFRGTAQQCSACHEDVHAGTFDRAGRPTTVAGKAGCARCHDTQAFVPVAGTFDHRLWTGYELTGAHVRTECSKCHPRATQGPKRQQLGKAAGTTCASCHVDPHAGQFARGGSVDCASCHTTATFRIETFDHSATRFPLDATHAAVACAACHKTWGTGKGAIVRYKPLGTTCGDCHALGEAHK